MPATPAEILAQNLRRGSRHSIELSPEERARRSAELIARLEEEERRRNPSPPPEPPPQGEADPLAAAYAENNDGAPAFQEDMDPRAIGGPATVPPVAPPQPQAPATTPPPTEAKPEGATADAAAEEKAKRKAAQTAAKAAKAEAAGQAPAPGAIPQPKDDDEWHDEVPPAQP